ncbi:hypothetical protein D2E24_0749 [Bifidobacterium samirii]|uniref:Uncharacterized protein n=2 Tax=Bifidobacterium samirii TaxID=2306974 RepID=A0A430FV68_9BIFI|nr:hypothetical protein D2E24_0749 [Bifidobacterium samirii]
MAAAALVLGAGAGMTLLAPRALADDADRQSSLSGDGGTGATGGGTADAADTADGDQSGGQSAEQPASADEPTLTIDEATAVVTASSGWRIRVTVANGTDRTMPSGTLTALVNAAHVFASRTDIQDWSQGEVPIPTPDVLGAVDVPELKPGASATVTVDASADVLASIAVWGPKPVLLDYAAGDPSAQSAQDAQNGTGAGSDAAAGAHVQVHTFLTRSSDGMASGQTPAMDMTVALPIASDGWDADADAISSLVEDGDTDAEDAAGVVVDDADAQQERRLQQLSVAHPALQIVADPATLKAAGMPAQVTALMQPSGFDITAYAAYGDADAYAAAGVDDADWSAQTALDDYRDAIGDQNASGSVVAWQGDAAWSLDSLTTAKRQGYDVVVADHEFDDSDDSTVHTGTVVVPTDAGDVTVLTQQRELSRLAQGQATSDASDGETSVAGRLARFVAQSAFYQMEQPYTSRNLLVCFGQNADMTMVDTLMAALEQAPWLHLTDLSTLEQAEPLASGDNALSMVADSAQLDDTESAEVASTLSALQGSRDDITRITRDVVDAGDGKVSGRAASWSDALLAAQSACARTALGGDADVAQRMTQGAAAIASWLTDGIVITPTESVSVVSETAQMPVTVSNTLPYPVHVQVRSSTGSMEIVTSRSADVDVPAHGDAQVTFKIRVSASGSARATLTLHDRDGRQFGSSRTTDITSVLRISDMSGFVIIGLAVLLGLLGLWRQFHREKDPDE